MFRLQVFTLVVLLLYSRSQPAAAQFDVELPGGAKVELVAVVDLMAQPGKAWQPDGKPCALAKEWPNITRVGSNASHGFVFRCQGFDIGQGIDFRLSPLGATPIPGDGVPEFVTMSSEVFPTLKKATIRVCVLDAWGPWQRFEVDGMRPTVVEPAGLTGKLYSLVTGVDLQHSPKSQLKVGVVLKGFSGKYSRDTEVGQCECVAHDRVGKAHATRGVMPYEKNQIEFFKLQIEDTDHYAYRMRPVLKWITFDNLALKADAGSEVKITTEDSELAKVKD